MSGDDAFTISFFLFCCTQYHLACDGVGKVLRFDGDKILRSFRVER